MSNSAAARRGLLFIVSAPSGTGKTTLVERLVKITPDLRMSRSYTSRAARETAMYPITAVLMLPR